MFKVKTQFKLDFPGTGTELGNKKKIYNKVKSLAILYFRILCKKGVKIVLYLEFCCCIYLDQMTLFVHPTVTCQHFVFLWEVQQLPSSVPVVKFSRVLSIQLLQFPSRLNMLNI